METNQQLVETTQQFQARHKTNSRQALRAYASGAALIYVAAISYCYLTGRVFETLLIAGVMTALAVFIYLIYKSI